MTELEPTVKRPALIWLTQALLVLLLGMLMLAAWGVIIGNAGPGEAGPPVPRVVMGLLLLIALAAPMALLFLGLARRHRWAWRGSIAFAICFVLLVVASQFARLKGPIAPIEIPPSQRIGAMLAQVTIPALLCAYAARLYFSPKVRAFLGVPQRARHGR